MTSMSVVGGILTTSLAVLSEADHTLPARALLSQTTGEASGRAGPWPRRARPRGPRPPQPGRRRRLQQPALPRAVAAPECPWRREAPAPWAQAAPDMRRR